MLIINFVSEAQKRVAGLDVVRGNHRIPSYLSLFVITVLKIHVAIRFPQILFMIASSCYTNSLPVPRVADSPSIRCDRQLRLAIRDAQTKERFHQIELLYDSREVYRQTFQLPMHSIATSAHIPFPQICKITCHLGLFLNWRGGIRSCISSLSHCVGILHNEGNRA